MRERKPDIPDANTIISKLKAYRNKQMERASLRFWELVKSRLMSVVDNANNNPTFIEVDRFLKDFPEEEARAIEILTEKKYTVKILGQSLKICWETL